MSGTTSGGLPYPTGSDLVRDGDNAIQALAEKVQSKYGSFSQSYIGGAVTTGPDGKVWINAPNLNVVLGATVSLIGDANWYAHPIEYAGNLVKVGCYDGNAAPLGNVGVTLNGWAYGN
jgi:hypothetical protein